MWSLQEKKEKRIIFNFSKIACRLFAWMEKIVKILYSCLSKFHSACGLFFNNAIMRLNKIFLIKINFKCYNHFNLFNLTIIRKNFNVKGTS